MFDIEPVSLVISLVIITLFSAPFVIYKRTQSQKIKAQSLFLEQLETGNNLKFDQSEKWRDLYFIGLDSFRKILVYVKFGAENTIHHIDLSKATDVKLLQMEREVKVDGRPLNVIDNLTLKIESHGEKRETILLEFYDCELFSDNMGELPIIQKWEKTVKLILKNNPSQVKKTVLI
jgi:hypothetical protein